MKNKKQCSLVAKLNKNCDKWFVDMEKPKIIQMLPRRCVGWVSLRSILKVTRILSNK